MLASEIQLKSFRELFSRGTELKYNKGEFIIRPGETLDSIFYIKSGLVKAYDITKYGEENLLVIRKTDGVFPLIWAITGRERDIIYQTLEPTVLYKISRVEFQNALMNNQAIIITILDKVVDMYRLHSERILNLEYRTVRERLVSYLITMSSSFSDKINQTYVFNIPLRQQDIASSINSTRETTSRELGILEKKGLITNRNSYITILNREKLQEML